jgi:hypothetical protein
MRHSNVAENQDDGSPNLPALFEAVGLGPETAWLEQDKDGKWWVGSSVAAFTELPNHQSEEEILKVTHDTLIRLCDELNEEILTLATFIDTYYNDKNDTKNS